MRTLLALMLLAAPAAADDRGLKVVGGNEIVLSLRVSALVGGVRRAVAPGQTLRTGDKVELFVSVDQPAYVYLAQVFADGTSAVLFPGDATDVKVAPGEPTRIPPAGQWFELDEHPGEENLVVVASAKPLEEADKEAKRALDEIRKQSSQKKTTAEKPAAGKKKPLALSLRTRGLVLTGTGADDEAVRAKSDASGVALFRFSFKHAR
jgi:hypothetical protein